MEHSGPSENFIACWCFDCKRLFFIPGDSPIRTTVCLYCGNKNYDFDMNSRYSKRKKERKGKKRKGRAE
jgi:hypothetical protein